MTAVKVRLIRDRRHKMSLNIPFVIHYSVYGYILNEIIRTCLRSYMHSRDILLSQTGQYYKL